MASTIKSIALRSSISSRFSSGKEKKYLLTELLILRFPLIARPCGPSGPGGGGGFRIQVNARPPTLQTGNLPPSPPSY